MVRSLLRLVATAVVVALVLVIDGRSAFHLQNGKRSAGSMRHYRTIMSVEKRSANFDASDIQIQRVLGRVDIEVDRRFIEESKRELDRLRSKVSVDFEGIKEKGSATTVRIFEGKLRDGTRCFVKEYLPVGFRFGRKELAISKKMMIRWVNEVSEDPEDDEDDDDDAKRDSDEQVNDDDEDSKMLAPRDISMFPFPTLLGSLRTDERIESPEFRARWTKLMPRVRPPEAGNLWLVFRWDEASFKNMKLYPRKPQIIETWDYFSKQKRTDKRWRFIRKMMRLSLETVDYLHTHGYCHNAISSDALWLSTTNQQEYNDLVVKLTDLGACQKFKELGPYAKEGVIEDLYKLGFVFLELIIASFSEDNVGAQKMRAKLGE
jgi:hypothetical protein